ncbi:GNAT family N-acetyltransferase [Longispora sp. NPDC051575]|uniref:GNAT family N-acetyltransferase n=1 Tax=Longispora sp. NPDC051575 TaxID=3154943 RepID=UPI0034251CEF
MIRVLGSADLDGFTELRRAAVTDHPGEFGTGGEDWSSASREKIAHLLATATLILGAFEGQQLVGMAGLLREPKQHTRHKAAVWGLYVDPASRRRGHARALVTGLVEHARTIDVEILRAVTSTENAATIGLLGSLGFEEFGVEPRARKVDGHYLDQVMFRREL